jgi:predicted RNA-binding Zn-ribbon protein involved in translation (DUF1610 family)
MPTPKIAVLDIETAPYVSYHWSLWDQNIALNQIIEERSIMTFAYKPIGGKVEVSTVREKRPRDDKSLLQYLWTLLDSTDIVIAQNGKKFDLPIINARMVMHGMKPYSPVKVIDTVQVAKQFGFTSKKLEWLAKWLTDTEKDDHKQFQGMDLWRACLDGNPRAWKAMVKYNKQDVVATEKVYLALRPWMTNHPNVGVYTGAMHACPACGSTHVQQRGTEKTQSSQYHRYQCQNCGKWSRGKAMLSSLAERKARLA